MSKHVRPHPSHEAKQRKQGKVVSVKKFDGYSAIQDQIFSKYKITRRQKDENKRKGKEKQLKVKDLLLAHKQIPLPSNYDKGTTIQHGISEMSSVLNRSFSILEEFMLRFTVHSPRAVFISSCRNYFLDKTAGRVLGYTSSNATQSMASTLAYYV